MIIDGHEILASVEPSGHRSGDRRRLLPDGPVGRSRARRPAHPGRSDVHQLPQTDGEHALHGLGHVAAWERVAEGVYELAIGAPWPTEGVATLTYELLDDGMRIELSWDDDTEAPCSIGLHPWFRRRLDSGDGARSTSLEPTVDGRARADDGLPTGRLVEPTPGPWDDCFQLAVGARADLARRAGGHALVLGAVVGRLRRAGRHRVRGAADRATGRVRPPEPAARWSVAPRGLARAARPVRPDVPAPDTRVR